MRLSRYYCVPDPTWKIGRALPLWAAVPVRPPLATTARPPESLTSQAFAYLCALCLPALLSSLFSVLLFPSPQSPTASFFAWWRAQLFLVELPFYPALVLVRRRAQQTLLSVTSTLQAQRKTRPQNSPCVSRSPSDWLSRRAHEKDTQQLARLADATLLSCPPLRLPEQQPQPTYDCTTTMGPSLRDHASFVRPATRERPGTRDQGDTSLVIPSRTSSLHSRITQPIPSTLNIKTTQRTPKTLTHAYMVCGVGREPSQWVRAPAPTQGKIGHMKGAVGQFWLPEILGSSPRLEQDNEIARALHAAMRVR